MGFASLGSGSSGNATIVAVSRSIFLVDCGFKVRTMERRLSQLDISPGDIDAIFITHEHSDHISGLAGFAHKYNIKTFASYGTQKNAFIGANCSIVAGVRIGDNVTIGAGCTVRKDIPSNSFVIQSDDCLSITKKKAYKWNCLKEELL